MKWFKPQLTLHPGLPKCATSAIQQAFVLENHRLARALNVNFLSAGFRPNRGHPDVIRVIDDPEGYYSELDRAVFLRRRYFLSSEALLSMDLKPICERFDLTRCAVTTRLPILQALSNYRFSGWITGSFDAWSKRVENNFRVIAERQAAKISRLKELPGDLVIVPLEAAPKGKAVSFFCETIFGARPGLVDDLQVDTGEQVNPSISFALADTLGRRLSEREIVQMDPSMRRLLVNAAKGFELAEDLVPLVPESLLDIAGPFELTAKEDYLGLLELCDHPIEAYGVLSKATEHLSKFIALPTPTREQQARLDVHAELILDSCLETRPS